MTAAAQMRIARLASEPAVHRAFRWLHLHQPQITSWQIEMLRIPAPTFGEAERAAWFLERFQQLGLHNVHLDEVGNALGELHPPGSASEIHAGPVLLLSAHLDTVFPPSASTDPILSDDGRINAPGACDNAAGLSALLGLAAACTQSQLPTGATVVFAANVGEEGQGDLFGMRHLFTAGEYAGRIAASIALEGGGSSALITQALASRRFRVTVTGPGGHSWTDAGAPNPILQLARALVGLEALGVPDPDSTAPRTTLNVGLISGGTSINSIPEEATAHLDLRSTDPVHLDRTAQALEAALRAAIPEPGTPRIESIGHRPGGSLSEDSTLMATIRAVDRHLNLRTEPGLGSTDANIPLSLAIPAIAIGTGGLGGGMHTLQEWYDPANRQIALRRILLIATDTARRVAESAPQQRDPATIATPVPRLTADD